MSKFKFTPRPLNQQTIVITGASSGIGLATAKMAAQRGAKVVLSARNDEELKRCSEEINQHGGNTIAVVADVTRYEDLLHLRDEAIRAFGAIDTWVNNAGTSLYGYLMDTDPHEERKLFETNFWGVRYGCKLAVEAMKDRGGVVINMGSETSAASQPLLGMYSASKHAIKAISDALRVELKDRGLPVEVSLIMPTAIDTPFAEHAANRLPEGGPALPQPQYSPDLVAEAILKCAQKPQRHVYVGGPARIAAIVDTFFPRVKDIVTEVRMKELKKGTKAEHDPEQEGLHFAPEDEGETRGVNKGIKFNNSFYTDVATLGFIRSFAHTARESIKSMRKAS